jgi:hypothetical protein
VLHRTIRKVPGPHYDPTSLTSHSASLSHRACPQPAIPRAVCLIRSLVAVPNVLPALATPPRPKYLLEVDVTVPLSRYLSPIVLFAEGLKYLVSDSVAGLNVGQLQPGTREGSSDDEAATSSKTLTWRTASRRLHWLETERFCTD